MIETHSKNIWFENTTMQGEPRHMRFHEGMPKRMKLYLLRR